MEDNKTQEIVDCDEKEVEASEIVDAEENLEATIDSLKDEIAVLNDKLLRTVADTQNYKKRLLQDTNFQVDSAKQNVLNDLLEVVDNLERALSSIEDDNPVKNGIKLTHEQLINVLKKYEVEKIAALGLPFDHNFHQAIMMEKDESQDSGIVLEEMLSGYKYKDKVLRPSVVKVNE